MDTPDPLLMDDAKPGKKKKKRKNKNLNNNDELANYSTGGGMNSTGMNSLGTEAPFNLKEEGKKKKKKRKLKNKNKQDDVQDVYIADP